MQSLERVMALTNVVKPFFVIVDATLKEMVPLKCHKPEEANHRTSEFLSKLQSNDM